MDSGLRTNTETGCLRHRAMYMAAGEWQICDILILEGFFLPPFHPFGSRLLHIGIEPP